MSPAPLPPNLPPRIATAEPVPGANPEWTTEARDMAAFHMAMDSLRTHQEEVNWLNNSGLSPSNDPTSFFLHQNRLKLQDANVQAELTNVFDNSDPSVLLDEMQLYIDGSRGEHDAAKQRMIDADTDSMGKTHDASVGFALMRHQAIRNGNLSDSFNTANTYAVKTMFGAQTAGRVHENASKYVKSINGYTAVLEQARDRFQNEQAMAVGRAEIIIQEATDKLDNWPIDSAIPGNEGEIRDLLLDLDDVLENEFNPKDSLRAQAQLNYVRLRYRLEQRLINAQSLGNSHNTSASMEEDGGIRLHTSTRPEDDVVIYGDGTTVRMENGIDVRRYPIGVTAPRFAERRLDATPPAGPLIETDQHGNRIHITAEAAFDDWEKTHSEANEVRAYGALNYEIAQGNALDARQTETLMTLDARVQQAPFSIQEIRDKASSEGRNLNQQELDAIDDIDLQRQDDEAEIRRVAAHQRAQRTQQNRLKYRRHLIEVGNRPVVPRSVVTGRIMRQTVEIDEPISAPVMRPNGRIEVQTTVDNYDGSQWTLLADGRHIWRGTPVQYRNADGTAAARPF